MTFIRAKEIPPHSGNWYDYEVETIHEGGKTIQRHIRYIGKSSLRGSGGVIIPHDSTPVRAGATVTPTSVKTDKPKATCKFCDSTNTRKFGTYKGTQNYFCNDCRTRFTGTDALSHGRVSPTYIANALNGFYSGMSFHDIENNIDTQTDSGVSHTAVIKWVNKFTTEAVRQTKDLHPKVGDTWIADETYVRVDKSKANVENPYSKSKKAKWVIFWDIIDSDTRFLLASHLTTTRGTADAKALMEKAAKRAGKSPKTVVTDSLAAYLDGIELAYGSEAKHHQGSPFNIEKNTNLIERFHGSLKERAKVMRAQKNQSTLQRFTDGWLVHYNFFRPHMSLENKTPAEVAGIKYDVKNWADLVGSEKQPIVRTLEPQPTGESA